MVIRVATVNGVMPLKEISGSLLSTFPLSPRRLRVGLPTSEAHMTCEAFKRLDVGIWTDGQPVRGATVGRAGLTGEDVPFEVFVPRKGLSAIGAENHDWEDDSVTTAVEVETLFVVQV